MGEAAADNADVVIVTDDNPRSRGSGRDPRRDPRRRAGRDRDRRPRARRSPRAVAMLRPGDVLCVAGKGHETGQIVGDRDHPFSDHEAVAAALAAEEAA